MNPILNPVTTYPAAPANPVAHSIVEPPTADIATPSTSPETSNDTNRNSLFRHQPRNMPTIIASSSNPAIIGLSAIIANCQKRHNQGWSNRLQAPGQHPLNHPLTIATPPQAPPAYQRKTPPLQSNSTPHARKHPMQLAAILLALLLPALTTACDAPNTAPTATPLPAPTAATATAPTQNLETKVHLRVQATIQAEIHSRAQATIQAKELPTATPSPTATPELEWRVQATIQAMERPTPTILPFQLQEQIIAKAGKTSEYRIRSNNGGYLHITFTSVEHLNESEPLDIDFQIEDQHYIQFRADNLISFAANLPLEKDRLYQFRFDNSDSWFAGKLVYFRYRWSPTPIGNAPVIPGYGQYAGTELCQRAAQSRSSDDADFARIAFSLGTAALTGDWFTPILSILGSILSGNEANTAANAIAAWGCGFS